jgi:hypothetical protein
LSQWAQHTPKRERRLDAVVAMGAVSCAAVLHGEAEKYGTAEEPITYKVEQTSDGKLYATVYGLQ